jgi:hypothetical protein
MTNTLSLARRAHDPGFIINPTKPMAWRLHANFIDGELDNRIPGKVTGWMRFYRSGKRPLKAVFDLEGDFHEDIRGKVIGLSNTQSSERNEELDREGTYMQGFSAVQRGTAGDITAGLPLGVWTEELAQRFMAQNELIWAENVLPLPEREKRRQEWAKKYRERIEAGELCYPYVAYPYIEWYSEANGRVVLELEPSQVEILEQGAGLIRQKTPGELVADHKRRDQAFGTFLSGMVTTLSKENRKKRGDGNVFGAVIR